MMTLEQALDKAAREIDAILVQRMDDAAFGMIAAGLEADDVAEIFARQHERNRAWRATTLADLRTTLSASLSEAW